MTHTTCPLCQKPTQESTRPFCSQRCKDVDLHRWFAGIYAIPGKDVSKEETAEDN